MVYAHSVSGYLEDALLCSALFCSALSLQVCGAPRCPGSQSLIGYGLQTFSAPVHCSPCCWLCRFSSCAVPSVYFCFRLLCFGIFPRYCCPSQCPEAFPLLLPVFPWFGSGQSIISPGLIFVTTLRRESGSILPRVDTQLPGHQPSPNFLLGLFHWSLHWSRPHIMLLTSSGMFCGPHKHQGSSFLWLCEESHWCFARGHADPTDDFRKWDISTC